MGDNIYPDLHEETEKASSGMNKTQFSEKDVDLLVKAADFAARRHRFQKRKDEHTPYINHPLGVAFLLTRFTKSARNRLPTNIGIFKV